MHYIGAIDQGTTSTRFMIFDRSGSIIAYDQQPIRQIYPQPGWVEHDPLDILATVQQTIASTLAKAGLIPKDLAAVGITNQRETTVIWERATGRPIHNALVWQDTRTAGICAALTESLGEDQIRAITGLPVATYFSGPKVRWILDYVPGARAAAQRGDLLFGTMDSWLLWNLTGGPQGGLHLTDVTNASRTLLMDLKTLTWSKVLLQAQDVPDSLLPAIRPSVDVYGLCRGEFDGLQLAGNLGDQQAALFGQVCFEPGEAKNTYGTGCFMLINTGTEPIASANGLLTTVGYQLGAAPPVYALEGSIAIAGALVQWLRDNLGLISSSSEIEALARTVEDNGDVYIVPAFSGLFAPYWRNDARGLITGLTRYANRGHIARAALEATAYQVREVLDAMNQDSGVRLSSLKVDGGMVGNELLMQFQADILGVPVSRPVVAETTALGAAYAAGLATGFWKDMSELRSNWAEDRRWLPMMPVEGRSRLMVGWKKAVQRAL